MPENRLEVTPCPVGPRSSCWLALPSLPAWLLTGAFAIAIATSAACGTEGPAVLGPEPDGAVDAAAPDDAAVVADARPGAPDAAVADAAIPVADAQGIPDAHTTADAHAAADAHTAADAHPGLPDAQTAADAHPAPDANVPLPDAAPVGYQCHPLDLSGAGACAVVDTARVTACSIDATTHLPSQNGWIDVGKPDGSHAFLCASQWQDGGGFYFSIDRQHLESTSSVCCSGGPLPPGAPAVSDPFFGTLHGPTHVKSQEMLVRTGGILRQNPYAVVVSNSSAAALYTQRLAQWSAWSGDGQPHPGPDGTGSYYFPSPLAINYVIVPTSSGAPMIVIGPEVSLDPDFDTPLGHPTLGACNAGGGTPLAFIGGTIYNTTLTNASGRFGHETTVTTETLANAAKLFNCYGIHITATTFSH